MIERQLTSHALYALKQFRALCITGPRQSGKTTLSRLLLKNKPYVTFENPDVQVAAETDPRAFLRKYATGAVFDEIQRVPNLFRYLQEILDNNTKRGQYILTGSNNILLQEQIAQSLAGRAGYLNLLPFSYQELRAAGKAGDAIHTHILRGGYPEIWKEDLDATIWLNSYLQTYVQRDIRQIKYIQNLAAFNRFIFLCANYAGQILNRDELGRQVGVDTKTIQSWLGLLVNSYIVFLQQPWHNNFNKRIIKSPKLYFHDTGLLCFLLGIKSQSGLQKSPQYGAIFENWIISEINKNRMNAGVSGDMYYFRDSTGNEVDLILEKNEEVFAIEIKSAARFKPEMLRGLNFWKKLRPGDQRILITGSGHPIESQETNCSILGWRDVEHI